MYPIGSNLRPWAQRLALSAVCGLLLTTSASAQFSMPDFSFPSIPGMPSAANPTSQSPKPLGTVLTVPLYDLGQIMAQNVIHQNNVNLLQVSQAAVGDMNTQVATISILHKNYWGGASTQPAKTCWLPSADLD